MVGRGGGPLYVFADTHGRMVGLIVVRRRGAALMVVFYAVLVATAPGEQRQQFVAQFRTSLGRFVGPAPLGSSTVTKLSAAAASTLRDQVPACNRAS